jgi:uncharacterized repeat protein (TIGR01451 family)
VTGNTVVTVTQVSDNAGAAMHTADRYPAPAVAQTDGNVLISWYRLEDDIYTSDWRGNIYYAVRDPAGRQLLPPTALTNNTTQAVQDSSPSTATFGDGHFAVVWQRYQDGTGISDVMVAVLDGAGGLIAGPDNLTANASGGDYQPRANGLADGNVLLTWHGYHESSSDIYYAVLDSAGTVVYPIRRLTHAPNYAYAPDAVGLRSGQVVIAWSQYGYYPGWESQIAYAVLDGNYYSQPNPGEAPWTGTYYNNEDLSGSPAVTRTDTTIDFQWGTGFPDPAVYTDHFSVRWTGTITPTAGAYLFTMGSDDGSRLWIDDQLLLDRWDASGHYSQTAVTLADSPHQVKMEMREVTGIAWAELTWQALLPNPLSRDNYYLSLARDGSDNAVLTWTDGAFERIYYAVLDGLGAVRTPPLVFRARHEWTDISQGGSGNGSLPQLTLAISKVATPDPVQAGSLLTYAITVHNTGFAPVTGVAVSDTVPVSTTFVSADSDGALVGSEVRWISMTLAAGSRLTVRFVVRVDDFLPSGTLLANDDYGVSCTEVPAPLMGAPVRTTVHWLRWLYLPLVQRNY